MFLMRSFSLSISSLWAARIQPLSKSKVAFLVHYVHFYCLANLPLTSDKYMFKVRVLYPYMHSFVNWPDAARLTRFLICCVPKAGAAPKAAANDQPAKAEKKKKAAEKGEKPAAKAPTEKKARWKEVNAALWFVCWGIIDDAAHYKILTFSLSIYYIIPLINI